MTNVENPVKNELETLALRTLKAHQCKGVVNKECWSGENNNGKLGLVKELDSHIS